MLFGEFNYIIDEKARLRMPSKLKSYFSNKYVITKGTNSCLFIFSKDYFEKEFLQKLSSIPTFNSDAQKPIRLFLASTHEVDEDNQGRFLLPTSLREYAHIIKNVVFIGVGNRVELWSEEEWNKYKGDEHNFDNIVSQLSTFDV